MFRGRNQLTNSLFVAFLLSIPASLDAQPVKPPPIAGHVIYAQGGKVWSQDVATQDPPQELASLPEGAVVEAMEANRDGSLIAIHVEGQTLWLNKQKLSPTSCEGKGRPSPAGECLACETANGTTLVAAGDATFLRKLPADLRDVGFKGSRADELIARGAEGVVGFSPATPGRRKVLATSGAKSHLLIAPDGSRGAAIFGDGETSRIFSFALDGTGVPRQIGGPGWPVVWSPDSNWVLIQEGLLPGDDDEGGASLDPDDGAAPAEGRFFLAAKDKKKSSKKKKKVAAPTRRLLDERACAAKAVGGEEKCWNGYQAIAFSPDVSRVLIAREGNLYVGPINGVKAERPKQLVEGVDPGATWVP